MPIAAFAGSLYFQNLNSLMALNSPDFTRNDNSTPSRGLNSGFDANTVSNPLAPTYYFQRSIMVFSVVFSVIFGAVLIILNLKDNKCKYLMALYAIIYTAFILLFLNTINANTMMTIAANALCAYFLITVFWNRYVGRTTLYQKNLSKNPAYYLHHYGGVHGSS